MKDDTDQKIEWLYLTIDSMYVIVVQFFNNIEFMNRKIMNSHPHWGMMMAVSYLFTRFQQNIVCSCLLAMLDQKTPSDNTFQPLIEVVDLKGISVCRIVSYS